VGAWRGSFEEGTLSFSEAAEERAKSYEQGRVLLSSLVGTARDLKLRCVGKNYDDASELYGGLESLLEQWEAREEDLEGLKIDALKAAVEFKSKVTTVDEHVSAAQMQACSKVRERWMQACSKVRERWRGDTHARGWLSSGLRLRRRAGPVGGGGGERSAHRGGGECSQNGGGGCAATSSGCQGGGGGGEGGGGGGGARHGDAGTRGR
jgi:hypothetical protein